MTVLVLVTWTLLAADPSLKDVFTWTDEEGITHYTNTPEEIPARYRRTQREVTGGELGEIKTARGASSSEARGAQSRSTGSTRSVSITPADASNEQQWRARFRAARMEIEGLKNQIASCEAEIRRLSTGRVLDSGGFLVTPPQLEENRDRLRSLERELEQAKEAQRRLHLEAGQVGVPHSWR